MGAVRSVVDYSRGRWGCNSLGVLVQCKQACIFRDFVYSYTQICNQETTQIGEYPYQDLVLKGIRIILLYAYTHLPSRKLIKTGLLDVLQRISYLV